MVLLVVVAVVFSVASVELLVVVEVDCDVLSAEEVSLPVHAVADKSSAVVNKTDNNFIFIDFTSLIFLYCTTFLI